MTPHRTMDIDRFHKSQNVPVPYPAMLHSEQKCAHFCSEWSIVGYGTGAFWDLWIRLIGSSQVQVMDCCLRESIHHLDQCWFNGVPWQLLRISIVTMCRKKVQIEITAISPRSQWVEWWSSLPAHLIHCCREMPYGTIKLPSTMVQVMTCYLMAPSHYLNQSWLLLGEVL